MVMMSLEESNEAAEKVMKFHADCQRRRALKEAKKKDQKGREEKRE